MNKIIYRLFPVLSLIFAMTFSSCLDSQDANNLVGVGGAKNQNQNFVEVHLTSNDNSNVLSSAYTAINKDTTITKFIPVVLTSGPATKDVTITFQLLDTLNAQMKSYVNDNGYIIPSSSKFTVVNASNQVKIAAGQSVGYISVKFTPANFLGDTYIFGIKLTAVSDPKYTLSNLTTGFVKFGIKNMYDGDYMVNGTMTDGVASSLTGAYPNEVYLITQDATSVAMWDVLVGGYAHLIMSGTSYSYYGSFAPMFIFDANNNVTSVVNAYGQGAGGLQRSGQIDPAGVNKYDPSTGTLKVSYWMIQKGVQRTHFVETFTYLGPRP